MTLQRKTIAECIIPVEPRFMHETYIKGPQASPTVPRKYYFPKNRTIKIAILAFPILVIFQLNMPALVQHKKKSE